jgi:archaellum component FlaC
MKKLIGNTEIEDSLNRLDRLTQEEARMASAELLKITHSVDDRVQDVHTDVQDVGRKVQGIEGGVQDILCDVQDVGDKVQGVDDRVQGIGSVVNDISSEVRGVDIKLDQVTRSLFRYHLLIVPSAQTYSQGINSEIIFYDGLRRQIHLSIITSHPKPITTARLNGSFKAVYSINGNPLTLSCGYTENVRLLLAFII